MFLGCPSVRPSLPLSVWLAVSPSVRPFAGPAMSINPPWEFYRHFLENAWNEWPDFETSCHPTIFRIDKILSWFVGFLNLGAIVDYHTPSLFQSNYFCLIKGNMLVITLPWYQGSWSPHGAHLGPTRPRRTPWWPHELCYLGLGVEYRLWENRNWWCSHKYVNLGFIKFNSVNTK